MYSILYFDIEDSISPPECGPDDIVLWTAQKLTRRSITGSFHIIGDKVRSIAQRQRRDIIDAVKRYDTSSHYNHGSAISHRLSRPSARRDRESSSADFPSSGWHGNDKVQAWFRGYR